MSKRRQEGSAGDSSPRTNHRSVNLVISKPGSISLVPRNMSSYFSSRDMSDSESLEHVEVEPDSVRTRIWKTHTEHESLSNFPVRRVKGRSISRTATVWFGWKNGVLMLWNAIAICETSKASWRMGKLPHERRLRRNQCKGLIYSIRCIGANISPISERERQSENSSIRKESITMDLSRICL